MERRQRLFWGDKNGTELGKKGGQKRKKTVGCVHAPKMRLRVVGRVTTPLFFRQNNIYILKKEQKKSHRSRMAWCYSASPRDCARSARRVVNVSRTLSGHVGTFLHPMLNCRMDGCTGQDGCGMAGLLDSRHDLPNINKPLQEQATTSQRSKAH